MKTLYPLLILVACAYTASAQQPEQQLPKRFPEIKEFKPELQYFDSTISAPSVIPKITLPGDKEVVQSSTSMPIKKPDPGVHYHVLTAKPDSSMYYHLQIKKPQF